MLSNDVYTGLWRDWRYDFPLNHRITLSGFASNALIAVIGIWVGTFTTAWVWSVIAYIIHALRVHRPRDGIRAQHQIVWRNDADPLTAFKDNLWICGLNWSPASPFSPPAPGTSTSNGRFRMRTSTAATLPLMIWAGFIVAAVFAPKVADPNGNVMLSAKPGNCGILQYPESQETIDDAVPQYATKILNDTLSARAYAQTCYSRKFSSSRSAACNFYTVPTLPYKTVSVLGNCPFSLDSNQLFANGPYAAAPSEYHNSSYLMYTNLLDSSTHFGINAPPQDRILFQKNVSCSPLSLTNRSRETPGLGTIANVMYTGYFFGYFFGRTEAFGELGYTYFHNSNADMDNVPYTVDAVYSDAGPNRGVWTPDYPFNITSGDVSLFFFAANSVTYKSVVNDPFFRSSTFQNQAPSNLPGRPLNFFKPYSPVQVMGCVDFYRLCRYSPRAPEGVNCTPSSGRHELLSAKSSLPLTQAQNVTLNRIFDMINNSDTYSSVYGTGTAALKASDAVLGLSSPGLQSSQWHVEVEGWFQTTLAKMQGYAVEYANHVSGVGRKSRLVFLDGVADNATWNAQCGSQRISSLGGHQTFSVFGLFFIFAFGAFFFLCSKISTWSDILRWIMNKIQGNQPSAPMTRKSLARLADGKFELQAMAMRNGNDVEVLQSVKAMPVYRPGSSMPRPRMDGEHVAYTPGPQPPSGTQPVNNAASSQLTSTTQVIANAQAVLTVTSASVTANASSTASQIQVSTGSTSPRQSTNSQPPDTTQANSSNLAAAPPEFPGVSVTDTSTSQPPSNNGSHSSNSALIGEAPSPGGKLTTSRSWPP